MSAGGAAGAAGRCFAAFLRARGGSGSEAPFAALSGSGAPLARGAAALRGLRLGPGLVWPRGRSELLVQSDGLKRMRS